MPNPLMRANVRKLNLPGRPSATVAVDDSEVRVPSHLPKSMSDEYVATVRLVRALGPISPATLQNVEAYCEWLEKFRQASKQVRREGVVIETRLGNYTKHPAVDTMRVAQGCILQLQTALGLDTDEAASIQGASNVPVNDTEDNPWK
jgi:P27 family predicted phage terminase small subunit